MCCVFVRVFGEQEAFCDARTGRASRPAFRGRVVSHGGMRLMQRGLDEGYSIRGAVDLLTHHTTQGIGCFAILGWTHPSQSHCRQPNLPLLRPGNAPEAGARSGFGKQRFPPCPTTDWGR
jgi:hypothetical protein